MILMPLTLSILILIIVTFYLDITFDTRTKKMLEELREMSELIKELEQEAKEMSSISATMYGQIVEKGEDKKDEQVQSEVCDTHGVSSEE